MYRCLIASKRNFLTLKKITCTSTICESINSSEAFKDLLLTVHQLLRLFLTLPITFATSERAFSALHRLKTYTRSQMTEKTNNCFLLHAHKDLTDDLDLVSIAKEFIQLQMNALNILEIFNRLFHNVYNFLRKIIYLTNFIVLIR